jgi:hypothetical protein
MSPFIQLLRDLRALTARLGDRDRDGGVTRRGSRTKPESDFSGVRSRIVLTFRDLVPFWSHGENAGTIPSSRPETKDRPHFRGEAVRHHFRTFFPDARNLQLVKNLGREKTYPDGTEVRSAVKWLSSFVLAEPRA